MSPTVVKIAASATMMNGDVEDVDIDYQDSYSDGDESFLPQHQLTLHELARRIGSKVHRFLNLRPKNDQIKVVQEQTRASLKVVFEALDRYDFSELSLSYNGGKDCLVLLILYLTALSTHPVLKLLDKRPLQTVYILSKHPFQEVEDFVNLTQVTYSLAVTRYAKGMKDAFREYLGDFPKVKAIFVGTRRTDPHGSQLTHFDETDHGWPKFVRIHPVIDWHYQDIWTFILTLNIPYCRLYDQGYTSLGGTTDTLKNPALRRKSHSDTGTPKIEFLPAYILKEDREERLGREKDWKQAQGSGEMLKVDSNHEVAVVDDEDEEPKSG